MQELINDIKKKKELQHLDDKFVKKELNEYLKKNYKDKTFLQTNYSTRSKQYKQIIKNVRSQLRRVYGLFRKEKLDLSDPNILQKHSSTKERLPYYTKLYKHLLKTKPKIILDLGCGLNPLSLPYMKLKDFHYHAYDINKEEIKVIKEFFQNYEKENPFFKGTVNILDITNTKKVEKLPKADIAFLFKMTDVIDRGKGHKNTELLLQAIPAEHIIVSFPTKTMSGKKMNFPRRKWIELLCERLNYTFTTFQIPGEIFYVVSKP